MKCMSVPPKDSSNTESLRPSMADLRCFLIAACAVPQLHIPKHLSGSAPDTLEEAILLCEPVEAVVALAHGADEAAEGVDLVVAGVAAVLVNLADAELDGSVVLGLDDASGGGLEGVSIAIRGLAGAMSGTHAFAGDVNYIIS
jgi:hypothetical protein